VKIRKIKENMRREKRRPMIIEVNAEDLIHVTTMIKSERIRTVLPPKKKMKRLRTTKLLRISLLKRIKMKVY
jgi:hypothetical protein